MFRLFNTMAIMRFDATGPIEQSVLFVCKKAKGITFRSHKTR